MSSLHNRDVGKKSGGWLFASLLAVSGCGGPQMAAPTDFSDGKVEFETDGRSGDTSEGEAAEFTFGPYSVTRVERNLTVGDGFENLEGFEHAEKRGFSFLFGGGGKTKLSATCSERAPTKNKALDGTVTVEKERTPAIACRCEEAGQTVTQLFAEDLLDITGPLTIGDVEAKVIGAYELDNGETVKGRPVGFRVEDSDGIVAGVGVMPGESVVWFRKGLEEPGRRRMACALTGLMLWVPPPMPEGDVE
jgi:hypothetical protein